MTPTASSALQRATWLLTVEAWWELMRAAFLVRLPRGRADFMQWALDAQTGTASCKPAETAAVLHAIARASRYHFKPFFCLERSLAALRMLRRRGIQAALQIGCRKQEAGHEFHAWIVDAEAKPLAPVGDEETYQSFRPA